MNYWPLLPEILVATMASIILLVDLYRPENAKPLAYVLSLATLVLAFVVTLMGFSNEKNVLFGGMYADDALADTVKLALYVVTFFVFVYSRTYGEARAIFKNEYYVLGLFALTGMMIMSSAKHFLTLYLGLELLALCLYAMVAFYRDSRVATEAAMKYFILGALASGMLLYGMSILYGLTGSLFLDDVRTTVATLDANNIVLVFALVFIVVALAFKLGAVPFHMWIPDVYEGAPTSTTAFLGTAPKIAGFALMFRLLIGGLEDMHSAWQDMLIIMALLSIGIGNIVAIAQTSIKRMLAYSTISHMGFLLLGLLSGTQEGYAASLFYAIVYAFTGSAAFGMVMFLSKRGFESDQLNDFKGLNQRSPLLALMMLIVMFSMAGVPPTIGFFAKLTVIQAVVNVQLVWVAVVAVLFAVIGAFYYLRVIKLMYFDAPENAEEPEQTGIFRPTLIINCVLLIALIPWVQSLLSICASAIRDSI
ncbi:MAG: NADH-quinone oxidoreductase subunit NuoN [Arenicellales bacterium WSBS_2016_MAG_OTU3]